ncbi:MAG TPA: L,D-transpeptidase family protein [Longimicrobiales bacterium]
MFAKAIVLAALLAPGVPGEPDLADAIRARVEGAVAPAVDELPRIVVGHELVHARLDLPRFYAERDWQPAWVSDTSLANARALVRAIRRADQEGLRPADYHLGSIELLLRSVTRMRRMGWRLPGDLLVDLDMLLTDAFLVLGSHLAVGRVEPTAIDPIWIPNRRDLDMVPALERALANGSVEEELADLLPPYIEYRALRDALARYRRIAREGGWPRIEQGGTMRPGERGEHIASLRARLGATRDLDPRLARGNTYDADVEAAVRAFQERHGLDETGVVDLLTLAELTTPVEQRIQQLIVNMERWRWLPQQLGERHARVNVAGFDFGVYENDERVMHMRAMVGHQYRQTPVFSDTITLVVFAPWWGVPRTIAVQDIVPRVVAEGADYLVRNRIQVWRGYSSPVRVDPLGVNWAAVDTANFPYRFRQEPGPTNPLGNVKFLFPNSFDVYVHDTQAREMFAQAERAFSAGCIRIERPADFAEYLLAPAGWTRERVEHAMAATTEATVRVPDPLPIHILYWTAWADERGRIQFRNDIYLRDEPLERALGEPAPAA